MPDKRTHRGPHPEDAKLFALNQIPTLSKAVDDFSLLLSKGYAPKSSLKLVCDRFSLTERQRNAVMRCGCSNQQLQFRQNNEQQAFSLNGKRIIIDGYNLLITLEAALSGAPVFIGRDFCIRDIAGIHGTYRKVKETIPAIVIVADILSDISISEAIWLFDSPVSNSGKLKTIIYELVELNKWPWQVKLLQNPDKELINSNAVVVTSDSDILDKCNQWSNITAQIITQKLKSANIIDLSLSSA